MSEELKNETATPETPVEETAATEEATAPVSEWDDEAISAAEKAEKEARIAEDMQKPYDPEALLEIRHRIRGGQEPCLGAELEEPAVKSGAGFHL